MKTKLFLLLAVLAALGLLFGACAPATPVVIEKEVIKEVEVEKPVIVEKEVVKEVPVERVVEKEVVKEVPVEKIVEKQVAVTATPAPEKVQTVVWMCRTGAVENKWEQEVVIPAFEAKYPNIKIEPLIIDQPDIAVKREAMIAAGEPLHVWSTNWGGDGFASDRYRGLIEDLTPLVERDQFDLGDYVPSLIAIYESEGKLWGIPFLSTGSYVYFNMDRFDEAGVDYPTTDWDDTSWTWDAMVATAKKLTHDYDDPATGEYGLNFDNLNLEGMPMIFGLFPWPEDAYDTGFASEVTIAEDPRAAQAYQARHDLMYQDKVMPDAGIGEALSALGGAFESGKLAMNMTGGWGHWNYTGLSEQFCWGARPIPYGDPEYEGPRAIIYTDPWVITAGLPEAEREAAWTFVKYLTSVDTSRSYFQSTNTPPTRRSLLEEWFDQFKECEDPDTVRKVFLGAYDYGLESSNHLIVRWDELDRTWGNLFDTLWLDPNAKAVDVVPELDRAVEEVLQKIIDEEKK
jgi:multiple sugar transport system substrate-binding protein